MGVYLQKGIVIPIRKMSKVGGAIVNLGTHSLKKRISVSDLHPLFEPLSYYKDVAEFQEMQVQGRVTSLDSAFVWVQPCWPPSHQHKKTHFDLYIVSSTGLGSIVIELFSK